MPDVWKRFTPAVLIMDRCLGRTWNGGRGGQCKKKPVDGDLCRGCKRLAHGKVTGPIPATKMKEFLAAEKKRLREA